MLFLSTLAFHIFDTQGVSVIATHDGQSTLLCKRTT